MSVALHPSSYSGEKPALIFADSGEVITYKQLNRHANQCAQLFSQLGCVVGDTIAIYSDNNPLYLELCWAAKNSGLHYACVSSHLTVEEASYIIGNCDAKVLLVSASLGDKAALIASSCPTIQLLMLDAELAPFQSYQRLRDGQSDEPLPGRPRGASMLYSSGTTGQPKGVRAEIGDEPPETPPFRHAALVSNYQLGADTVFINPGPFYHAAPLRIMMAVQRMGGTAIGFKKFNAETVLRAIQQYKGSHGFFVPTMFVRFLELDEAVRQAIDVSAMRYAIHGAAPCSIPVKEAMLDWWGLVLFELYGGTEGFGQTYIGPEQWLLKKGSVGRAAAGCEIRILDENFNRCAVGKNGKVYMGNGRVFHYYKDEEKTLEVTGPEGLATMGDIGYLDEEGYLFLTDRQAHMIISGGVNIYPLEIERVIEQHPAVADVAVIGVPSEQYGETVKAVVQAREQSLSAEELQVLAGDIQQYCRQHLSSVKCPKSIDFSSELPRSEAGKLLKRLIKAPYWADKTAQ